MTIHTELQGRIVLVTGGANGIGEATVRAFHGQGARVFFCDTDARAGERLANELGAGVNFLRVDLRRESDICRWVSRVAARGGGVHVLVNNAAIDTRMPLEHSSLKFLEEVWAVNLRAYILMAREAARHMAEGHGLHREPLLGDISLRAGEHERLRRHEGRRAGLHALTRARTRAALHPRERRVSRLDHDRAPASRIRDARRQAHGARRAMR
jgi:NAD(P)-dependent dehydrogenase (short-subunit alcohol dehydrogenase family)